MKKLLLTGAISALMATSLLVGAKSSGVVGTLDGVYHYVPILEDYMDGYTKVNNNSDYDFEKVWAKTKVTVTDNKGNSNTDYNIYTGSTGFKAVENWESIRVKIRSMYSANGVHIGTSDKTDLSTYPKQTKYSTWER